MGTTTVLEVGGFWHRVGAWLLDRVLLTLAPVVVPLLALIDARSWHFSIALLTSQLPWIYTVVAHGRFGRTVGKAAAGLRVVRAETYAPIGFGRAIVRDLPKIVFTASVGVIIPALTVWGGPFGDLALEIPNGSRSDEANMALFWLLVLVVWAAVAYLAWFLADAIAMLASPERRSLHDLMAGTVVVTTTDPPFPEFPSSRATPPAAGPATHAERGW